MGMGRVEALGKEGLGVDQRQGAAAQVPRGLQVVCGCAQRLPVGVGVAPQSQEELASAPAPGPAPALAPARSWRWCGLHHMVRHAASVSWAC
jgi:hypothetical protein